MASNLRQQDKNLLSAGNKIRIGNKPYENGVFGSRENRDFIFFQLSDLNGNVIEFRNIPFSQISLQDNGNLLLQPPQHFKDSEITSGTYNVTYRFLRRLAGNDTTILVRTTPNAEDGKFYIWEDYQNIEITDDGIVYEKLNVNGDYFERGQELQVKNLKYQIDAISPSRTEVRLRAQNFDGLNYKEDFFRLGETVRKSISTEGSVIEFLVNEGENLNDVNTLRITPQIDDFVFTPRMVDGTITINDVYLVDEILTTPKSDDIAINGGGELVVIGDLTNVKFLANEFTWDANLHEKAIEVQNWTTGYLSYLQKPTSIWNQTMGLGYWAHWVQDEGKDGGVCMKFPDINQTYEQTIDFWPVGEPHRPLLISQVYNTNLATFGVSHGDNIVVTFDGKSTVVNKPLRVTARYPNSALTEDKPTNPPNGFYDPEAPPIEEEIPPMPDGFIGPGDLSGVEPEPPSNLNGIVEYFNMDTQQAQAISIGLNGPLHIGMTTADTLFGGVGFWKVESVEGFNNTLTVTWEINSDYSGFNLFDGLVSTGGQWVWDGIAISWMPNTGNGYSLPEATPGTVNAEEFPNAVNKSIYQQQGVGVPVFARTTNIGENAGWVTGFVGGGGGNARAILVKDDLLWEVIPNIGSDNAKHYTFTEFFLTSTYVSSNSNYGSIKMIINEEGDGVVDANGKTLDYLIFANGGYIQSITRDRKLTQSEDTPAGYVICYNDGLGTSKSNKIANIYINEDFERLIEIKAVENLSGGEILNQSIVNNGNRYEITLRTRPDKGYRFEFFFLVGSKVFRRSTIALHFLNTFPSSTTPSGIQIEPPQNLSENEEFNLWLDIEPQVCFEMYGIPAGNEDDDEQLHYWSKFHHIKFNEPQNVKKVGTDEVEPGTLVGNQIESTSAINDIFFNAGISQRLDGSGGQELQFGVLNPSAINYNPQAVYLDNEIEPEFDYAADPRKIGVLSPDEFWRWSGAIDPGWEYQGVVPLAYSYTRPAEPPVRTTKSNEWETFTVTIPIRDDWILGSTSTWQLVFEGHDIFGTDTFGVSWIDNVEVRFEFTNQSITEEVLKPFVAQIKTVSDDGLTITTNKTFSDVALELGEDDNPAEAFYDNSSNNGVYSSYQTEYLIFNPRELRTYIKYENSFFLTTNFRQDKQSINNYPHGIVFKLYQPLPQGIKRFDEITIVKEMAETSVERMKVVDFIPEEVGDRVLKSPDLGNLDSGIVRRSSQFKSETDLLTSDTNISETLRNQFISQSLDSAEINVDYTQYKNFVNFGSVQRRLENFKYKLELIESYKVQSGSLESISGSLKDIRKWETLTKEVKNNFDAFENYMFFESSSYVSSSLGVFHDNAWPKASGAGTVRSPYVLAHTTSSQATAWYTNSIKSASLYDEENLNKLSSLLPEHIKVDTSNELYLKFTDMLGHHFDEIWLYIKAMGDVFDRRESLDQGISKDLLYEVGKSLGWTLSDGTDLVSLPRYATGAEVTGSSYSDYSAVAEKDMSREIWSRIINNMPFFLKHKGTVKALKGLINTYGIPSTILRVKEYGGPNVPNSDLPQFEISRKFTKALDFRGSQFVTTPWTGSLTGNERKPDTIEFRFRAATGSNQILVEKQSANPSSSFYIRLKDNNSVDNFGHVAFQLSGSDGLKEISSSNLPVYDGEFYSVMLRRTSGSDASNVSQSFELSVGKYDASRSKLNIFSAVTMSTDIAASSSFNLNYATDGTIYIGGSATKANVGVQFSGSIMEYRHWTETLGVKHFKNHIANPQAYEGNHQTSSYQNLVLRYSFNDNKNLATDTVGIRDVSSNATTSTSGSHSGFTGNFFSNVVDETKTHIPSIGALRRVTNKIRIESNPIKSGEVLQINKRATNSAYDSAPNDSNKVGIFFAPTDVINNDIINSVGDLNFDNILGDPRDVQQLSYRGLKQSSDSYWKKYNAPNNFWDYLRLLKFYDQSLFPQLKKMIPARAKSTVGVLVEPNIFERPKVVMGKKPIFEDLSFTSSINLTDGVVDLSGSFNTGIEASSFDAYTGQILVNSYETGSTNYKWTGSYDTYEGIISDFKNSNFDLSIWQQLGSGLYITSSITFGDIKPKEVHQPIISGSRIFGRNQQTEKFYTSQENATKGIFNSSSLKDVGIDNLADENLAVFNSFYAGVKNTENTTIDGGSPIEIVITSPTKLVTQKGGDSTLTTGDGIIPGFKKDSEPKGIDKIGAKATGEVDNNPIQVTLDEASVIEKGGIPKKQDGKTESKPIDVMKVVKAGKKGKKGK